MLNTGISRAAAVSVRAGLVLPPFYVEGTAYAPGGSSRVHLELATMAPFFPVTNAMVVLQDGTWIESAIILVNRDTVAALSQLS